MEETDLAEHTSREAPRERRQLLIVGNHPVVRQGLAQLINQEADLQVCGEAADATQAQEAVAVLRPDLVVLDLTMPGSGALDLIKILRSQTPGLPILVLSMHEETLYAERVLRIGARGYIMKQEAVDQVLEAIRCVLGGEIYVSQRMMSKLLQTVAGPFPVAEDMPLARLSNRELDVLRLLGQGYRTRQIAQALHLSVKTVETHRANIMKKLQLEHATELVRYAVHWADGLASN